MLRLTQQFRKEAGTVKKGTMILVVVALWIGISAASGKDPVVDLPKILTLGSLSKVYEPVRFNHAEHVSYASGCADCHHQHIGMQVSPCLECHRVDASVFRKNASASRLKPCGECHPAAERPPGTERPKGVSHVELKSAYHQACMKCHKSDVGSGVKNLQDCTVMCHAMKGPKKGEEKR
jgi:hypothetical protein